MLVLDDGRIYIEAGEHFPFVCPQCEHIMVWFETDDLIVCEKCDHEDEPQEFSKFKWKLLGVN